MAGVFAQSPRVALRALRASDAEAIADGCADADVARFMPGIPSPYTLEDAYEFITEAERRWSDEVEAIFAIAEPGGLRHLGHLGVELRSRASGGYWMHRDARGKGLMTEALELGIEWAYETRGLARFSLTTHPDNVASQRVAEKAGFHQVGATVPHDEVFRDGTTTAILFHRDLR